jgi:hypothetical protein
MTGGQLLQIVLIVATVCGLLWILTAAFTTRDPSGFVVRLLHGDRVRVRNLRESQFGDLLNEMGFRWTLHPVCPGQGSHRHDVKVLPEGPYIEIVSSRERRKSMCSCTYLLYMAEEETEAMRRWILDELGTR